MIKSRTLDAGEGWSYGGDDQLDYDYRLICSENYYGRDCYKHCKDRDDNFGHYKCDNKGRKVCLPGWTGGDYCTTRKYTFSLFFPRKKIFLSRVINKILELD